MKSVLISIRPKWCEQIAGGNKTVEVRKTKPKINTPFKCYIYCTKGDELELWLSGIKGKSEPQLLNGKIIGEFVCDEIIEAKRGSFYLLPYILTGLTLTATMRYAKDKSIYGWHISDLVIYDKPKELNEFYCRKPLTRPPQSWCYVERKPEKPLIYCDINEVIDSD